MKTKTLGDDKRCLLAHCCRTAAERYDEHTRLTDEDRKNPTLIRLAAQFKRQAFEARELAVLLEDAEDVEVIR